MYGDIGNNLWFGKGARERNVPELLELGLNCNYVSFLTANSLNTTMKSEKEKKMVYLTFVGT